MSDYIPKALKVFVGERANHCCEYCYSQARFATQSFAIDHIQPYSIGGATEQENLALACPGCNSHKSIRTKGRDPITQKQVCLYHPRQHIWSEHFNWSEKYTTIVGLIPIGRTTIITLQINRSALINLRQVLYAMGEHPPTKSF
jgi:hypothetical protein